MSDGPPIPAEIWRRILAFLKDGRTGQIVMNVHQGTVQDIATTDKYREVRRTREHETVRTSTQ